MRALVEFGFPMGPFAMADLAGLDVGWRNRSRRACARKSPTRCAKQETTAKKPAGVSIVTTSVPAPPHPDDDIESLIIAASRRLGLTRRAITKRKSSNG